MRNIYDKLKKHLAFVLTFSITYVIGILLIVVQWVAVESESSKIEIMINSLVPTTITYVLGCVLVNIVEILESNNDNYVFNIITCLLVFIYVIIFCIYMITGFSIGWVIGEFVTTAILLVFNILCYREKYQHRNHKLA